MNGRLINLFAIKTFLLLISMSTTSASILLTSSMDFEELLNAGAYTEDFGDVIETRGSQPNPTSFESGGFAYEISSPAVFLWANETNFTYGTWLSSAQVAQINITFTSGNVTAVGGNFFLTQLNESAIAGNVFVSIDGADAIQLESFASGSQPFLGFVSETGDPFSSLVLTMDAASSNYISLTNFTVGTAIPEPAAWVSALGLLAFGAAFFRRRRSAE